MSAPTRSERRNSVRRAMMAVWKAPLAHIPSASAGHAAGRAGSLPAFLVLVSTAFLCGQMAGVCSIGGRVRAGAETGGGGAGRGRWGCLGVAKDGSGAWCARPVRWCPAARLVEQCVGWRGGPARRSRVWERARAGLLQGLRARAQSVQVPLKVRRRLRSVSAVLAPVSGLRLGHPQGGRAYEEGSPGETQPATH